MVRADIFLKSTAADRIANTGAHKASQLQSMISLF